MGNSMLLTLHILGTFAHCNCHIYFTVGFDKLSFLYKVYDFLLHLGMLLEFNLKNLSSKYRHANFRYSRYIFGPHKSRTCLYSKSVLILGGFSSSGYMIFITDIEVHKCSCSEFKKHYICLTNLPK